VPIPDIPVGPTLLGVSLGNWLVDAALWGAAAWLVWPRRKAGTAAR